MRQVDVLAKVLLLNPVEVFLFLNLFCQLRGNLCCLVIKRLFDLLRPGKLSGRNVGLQLCLETRLSELVVDSPGLAHSNQIERVFHKICFNLEV